MISDKYECIFVHVPKTAGQSIEKIFLDLHHLSWKTRAPLLLRYNDDPEKGPERLAHLKAAQYVQLGYATPEKFSSYFKFSFVRNPWDRLVSEYRYLELEGRVAFSSFVERSFARTDAYSNAALHIEPQTRYLCDDRGNFLVDFIGRFENLEADFAYVARKLELGEAKLAHRNVSRESRWGALYRRLAGRAPKQDRKRPYQDYYGESELRERVTEFYADDVERFGYKFDGSFPPQPIISQERTKS